MDLFDDDTKEELRKSGSGESQVVFTEMGEFFLGLQFDKLQEKKTSVDVLPKPSAKEEEPSVKEEESVITPDKTIREVPIGKGLSEALNFLRELAGRNTDKKKSRLIGVRGDEKGGEKEIRIDRTDEYGRKLTPKESFRLFSHQFHGKGPGKKKQDKRMRQHQEELKMKNPGQQHQEELKMKNPGKQHQEELKMKNPGQFSDPRSGFATTNKGMLGDNKKVGVHFLGVKRKFDSGRSSRFLKFRNI